MNKVYWDSKFLGDFYVWIREMTKRVYEYA